jgi:hypothetical protein
VIVASAKKTFSDMEHAAPTARGHAPYFSVHYKFDGDFGAIDLWLSQNCRGKFEYSIERKPHEPGQMVDVVLEFEKKEDRTQFKDMILSKYTS